MDLGATAVISETVEAGLQLGETLLTAVGLPADTARQLIDERRLAEFAVAAGREKA